MSRCKLRSASRRETREQTCVYANVQRKRNARARVDAFRRLHPLVTRGTSEANKGSSDQNPSRVSTHFLNITSTITTHKSPLALSSSCSAHSSHITHNSTSAMSSTHSAHDNHDYTAMIFYDYRQNKPVRTVA